SISPIPPPPRPTLFPYTTLFRSAVDHHHPLRALASLGFSDSSAPFLAGAKLPSRKDSLHCSCFRWLSSARNARQILSHTPCSSRSEEHTSELQSRFDLVCRLLLE